MVRILQKWFNLFVVIFLTLIITNTLLELLTDWKWDLLGDTILTRMAVLMTLLVGWFFIISHIWEVIMLGYARIFRDKVYAKGVEEHHRKVLEWNRRRIQAEKEGKEFNESIPEPKHTIKSSKK